MIKVDQVKELLKSNGFTIANEEPLPNNMGTRLSLDSGQIVNIFKTGKCQIQGKNQAAVNAIFAKGVSGSVPATEKKLSNQIFVVYGHDNDSRTQLEAMLRRWGLEPLILDQLPSGGQTLIEKLESYTTEVGFAVVLATPDDEGHKAEKPDEKSYRARQNVVLELGMLLAKLGREKVAILLKEQEKMERPSDIQGLIYFPFKDDVADAAILLAKEMASQGYDINVTKL